MSISVALCMAMIGINDGFYQAFFDVMVTHRLGHVQVRHTDYAKTKSLYDTIDSANSLYDEIGEMPSVKQRTGRLYGNALVSGDVVSSGSMITGVFPSSEVQFSSIGEQIIDGRYLNDSSHEINEVVLGKDLAQTLGVSVGSEVFLFTQGSDGSMVYDLYSTVGIYQSGNVLSDRGLQMHLQDARDLLLLEDKLHEILVLSEQEEEIATVASSIDQINTISETPEIVVNTWWETSPQTLELMGFRDIGTRIFLGVVFFIAGFGILNTMVMSVFERTTELGVLKALGLRPWQIVWMVVLEVVMLSTMAAIFGFSVGLVLDWYLMTFGIDISNGTAEPVAIMGAYLEPRVYAVMKTDWLFTPVTTLFCISVLASLWPAYRASRLNPIKAIRSE